jgi:hypothetical protein
MVLTQCYYMQDNMRDDGVLLFTPQYGQLEQVCSRSLLNSFRTVCSVYWLYIYQ